jgi:hypothetical protein
LIVFAARWKRKTKAMQPRKVRPQLPECMSRRPLDRWPMPELSGGATGHDVRM